jgi:hypothetical protein
MSALGLGRVKGPSTWKLIGQISPQIATRAMTISERARFERSEEAFVLLVSEADTDAHWYPPQPPRNMGSGFR